MDKCKEIEDLQRKLAAEKKRSSKLQQKLETQSEKMKKVFNEDQMDKMGRTSTRGCKWSDDSIKKGLKLRFACGTTGYEMLLAEDMPLPSIRSLNRKMEHISMEPGILNEVFSFLKLKTTKMNEFERVCCLTLDEMSIQPGVQYDKSSSCIRGETTLPGDNGVATHALVFMLAGIGTRWKQTVAYHFTSDGFDGKCLQPIVNDIIQMAEDVGLHVICVTSDMGSANRSMHTSFGVNCTKKSVLEESTVNKIPHPVSDSGYLHFMFDVPHLVKNLKTSLFNGNTVTLSAEIVQKFDLPSPTVTLDPIKKLMDFQVDHDLRITPKITSTSSSHFDKMKVTRALHLFSKSVSAGLRYLAENEGYSTDLLTTAWFIDHINTWFDLMSSRSPVMALSRAKQANYDAAIEHLKDTLVLFKTMVIGKQWKPVQTGIIQSTLSILDLQEELLGRGFQFVLTSRFTQDCLENMFSCVRLKSPTPSCLEFRIALKIISIAQYLKCPSTTSYQEDDGTHLAEFLHKPEVDPEESQYLEDLINLTPMDLSTSTLCQAERASLHYLAGYCIRRVEENTRTCTECIHAVKVQGGSEIAEAALTNLKEYKKGALTHCTDSAMDLFTRAESSFRQAQDELKGKKNIVYQLTSHFLQSSSDIVIPNCHDLKKKLLGRFFTVRLYIYAKQQAEAIKRSIEKKRAGDVLGSKSVAMRSLVKNIK